MRSYVFPVTLEESEGAWHVCVPELESKGAATWGKTREEALGNIQEVMQMVLEEMLEDGEDLPASVRVSDSAAVAINV